MNPQSALINTFFHVAAFGAVIDGITVGLDAKPDTDPAENWTSIGCVTNVELEAEKESGDDVYCPRPSGGYQKITEETIVGRYINLSTREMSELAYRLGFGADAPISDNTNFKPFNRSTDGFEFWCKFEHRDERGTSVIVMDVACRITLNENLTFSKDRTRPVYRLEILDSPLNTADPGFISG